MKRAMSLLVLCTVVLCASCGYKIEISPVDDTKDDVVQAEKEVVTVEEDAAVGDVEKAEEDVVNEDVEPEATEVIEEPVFGSFEQDLEAMVEYYGSVCFYTADVYSETNLTLNSDGTFAYYVPLADFYGYITGTWEKDSSSLICNFCEDDISDFGMYDVMFDIEENHIKFASLRPRHYFAALGETYWLYEDLQTGIEYEQNKVRWENMLGQYDGENLNTIYLDSKGGEPVLTVALYRDDAGISGELITALSNDLLFYFNGGSKEFYIKFTDKYTMEVYGANFENSFEGTYKKYLG